jgi:hypothetical protein
MGHLYHGELLVITRGYFYFTVGMNPLSQKHPLYPGGSSNKHSPIQKTNGEICSEFDLQMVGIPNF